MAITRSGPQRANLTHWNGSAVAAPATAGVPKVAIEAAGDFAQGAADKVWSSGTRTLTGSVTVSTVRASSSQRGIVTLASASSATASVSSVTVTRAHLTFNGWSANNTTDHHDGFHTRVTLTSATVVTGNRNTAGAVDSQVGHDLMELL